PGVLAADVLVREGEIICRIVRSTSFGVTNHLITGEELLSRVHLGLVPSEEKQTMVGHSAKAGPVRHPAIGRGKVIECPDSQVGRRHKGADTEPFFQDEAWGHRLAESPD